MIIDKAVILNELKKHGGFKTEASFAAFLGISPQNLGNWRKRNTFDVNLLLNLFTDVNKSWLLTGEGEMFKCNESQELITIRDPRDIEMIELLKFKIESLESEIKKLKK